MAEYKISEKSIEEQVEDIVKVMFNKANIRYYTKNEPVNSAIDNALAIGKSKSGGEGGNYPDIKLVNRDGVPIMIEVKGDFDSLMKYHIDLDTDCRAYLEYEEPNIVTKYAINGALHYGKVLLDNTDYPFVYVVGITGYYGPNTPSEYDENNKRIVHLRYGSIKMTRDKEKYSSKDILQDFPL